MEFNDFFYEYYLKDLKHRFDANFYTKKYPDVLKFYTIERSIDHWRHHGHKELRACSENYQNQMENLKVIALEQFNTNKDNTIKEKEFNKFFYLKYLKNLPYNFNAKFYLDNNPDVKKYYNSINCINHWKDHGQVELRYCSQDYKNKMDKLRNIAYENFKNKNFNSYLDVINIITSENGKIILSNNKLEFKYDELLEFKYMLESINDKNISVKDLIKKINVDLKDIENKVEKNNKKLVNNNNKRSELEY